MGGFSQQSFGESFNGLLGNDCGFSDSFSSGSFNTCVEVVESVTPASGGAGGKRYRYISWEEPKKKKALKKEIVEVQKQIQVKRRQVDHTQDLYQMQRLIEQIKALQEKLMKLLEEKDRLNKRTEDDDEMAIVLLAYRMRH